MSDIIKDLDAGIARGVRALRMNGEKQVETVRFRCDGCNKLLAPTLSEFRALGKDPRFKLDPPRYVLDSAIDYKFAIRYGHPVTLEPCLELVGFGYYGLSFPSSSGRINLTYTGEDNDDDKSRVLAHINETDACDDAILSTFRSHLIRIMSENAFDAENDT